jgi:transposase-like protein DUF772
LETLNDARDDTRSVDLTNLPTLLQTRISMLASVAKSRSRFSVGKSDRRRSIRFIYGASSRCSRMRCWNACRRALIRFMRSPVDSARAVVRGAVAASFYSIRSERLLTEQLDYNLLFRRFAGVGTDTPIWTPETFSMTRDRFLNRELATKSFAQVLVEAKHRRLFVGEHFTVDGTRSTKDANGAGRGSRTCASNHPRTNHRPVGPA